MKFSDFYFARASGSRHHPRCHRCRSQRSVPRARVPSGLARRSASDVYSLALALSGWVFGSLPAEPQVDQVREKIRQEPLIGPCSRTAWTLTPASAPPLRRLCSGSAKRSLKRPPKNRHDAAQSTLRPSGTAASWRDGTRSRRASARADSPTPGWPGIPKPRRTGFIKQFHNAISPADAKREYAAADKSGMTGVPGLRHPARLPGPGVHPRRQPQAVRLGAVPSPNATAIIALDVLEALGYLHERDLVHRDITPTNVIITPEGRAKLIDLGVRPGRGGRPSGHPAVHGT